MPQTYIKLSDKWVQSNNIFAKLDGEWKRVKTVWAKVNGVWVRAGGTIYLNINANVANWNMRAAITAAGYNPDASPWQVEITVAPGVTVYSTSTSIPAMQIDSLPAGATIKLINNGMIVGCGGSGGLGANQFYPTNPAYSGSAGGTALLIRFGCLIVNNGIIGGGGGGGGGGNCHAHTTGLDGNNCGAYKYNGGYGGNGAGISAATPGNMSNPSTSTSVSSRGGNGGGLGSYGAAGVNGVASSELYSGCSCSAVPGAAGGAGGKFIDGNSFASWITPGNRYGAVS